MDIEQRSDPIMDEEKSLFTITLPSDDSDINGLAICITGMLMTSKRMRHSTINYLYDRFIVHPPKEEEE